MSKTKKVAGAKKAERGLSVTEGERDLWKALLGTAEQNCDKWQAEAEDASREILHLRRELDRVRETAAEAERDRRQMPDGITDEMVERFHKALAEAPGWAVGTLHAERSILRHFLAEALTEPQRPEWADAPAVLAVCNDVMDRRVFVRHSDDWWKADMYATDTAGLSQVTPLYPKEFTGEGGER